MKQKKQKVLAGFSMGEVILSMAVLVVGILPIVASLSNGLRISFDSQETIASSGLAQEGVELVLSVRDNNILTLGAENAWSGFPAAANDNCRVSIAANPANAPVINCPGAAQGDAYYGLTVSGGLYKNVGVYEKFKRRVYFRPNGSGTDKSYDVVSAVYWGKYTQASTLSDIETNCHASSECVYSKVKLTGWK